MKINNDIVMLIHYTLSSVLKFLEATYSLQPQEDEVIKLDPVYRNKNAPPKIIEGEDPF